ncbi:hypothetical protein M413DRAFT_25562 [Hebeloma cylindrosporum]|uniref:Uncharacterized protein n=1 Tax=Hebeloma cylindrosporum TaxID=76867 RepID=A0A0C3CIT0_HEBCY|nr:hypothetical protein M413DRAFT_25562 [Hebeloma cylindrosporum h7]
MEARKRRVRFSYGNPEVGIEEIEYVFHPGNRDLTRKKVCFHRALTMGSGIQGIFKAGVFILS